ncbi:MAG: hypothetical protein DRI33_03270 [Caldiserica bacterium]|nr:MAG: hypothetical protein DRI33_03270 [Caldisericota bacterium]
MIKEKLKQVKNLKELLEIAEKDTMMFRLAVKSLNLKELLSLLDKLDLPIPDDDDVINFLIDQLTKKLQDYFIKAVLS